MTYEIEFANSAKKALKKITQTDQIRILTAIQSLQNNPRTGNVRPMVGSSAWRLRVGDYRVIYDICDDRIVIVILRVGHRREVYRK